MSCKASLDCLQYLIEWGYPSAEEALESYLTLLEVLGERANKDGRDYSEWVSWLNATSKNVVLLDTLHSSQQPEKNVINS